MAKSGRDVHSDRAEHAVPDTVDTLVDTARCPLSAGPGAQVLQLGHVDPTAQLQRSFDHAVVAPGSKQRPALPEDVGIAPTPGQSPAAEGVGELVAAPEHQTVGRGQSLERVERRAKAVPFENGEDRLGGWPVAGRNGGEQGAVGKNEQRDQEQNALPPAVQANQLNVPAMNVPATSPITRKRTIAAMITTAVYPIALSSGAFISTGRPR
jgi:hypothetical protein